jgi:hypothetical protein
MVKYPPPTPEPPNDYLDQGITKEERILVDFAFESIIKKNLIDLARAKRTPNTSLQLTLENISKK